MVSIYGMSDKLGAINFRPDEYEVFIGRTMGHARPYSEEVAAQIDAEVKRLIDGAYDRCKAILSDHADRVRVVAECLLEHETMDADTFQSIMGGEADSPLSREP